MTEHDMNMDEQKIFDTVSQIRNTQEKYSENSEEHAACAHGIKQLHQYIIKNGLSTKYVTYLCDKVGIKND